MSNKQESQTSIGLSPAGNQLTVLALMVALVCIGAGIAIAFASQHLGDAQRWVLIAFLILFPIAGLGLCTWLILRHHNKLFLTNYEGNNFWKICTPDKQRHKLNVAVTELSALMSIPPQQRGDLRSAYIVAEDLALRQIEQEMRIPIIRHAGIDNAVFDGLGIVANTLTCIEMTFLVKPLVPQDRIDEILKKIEVTSKTMKTRRPNCRVKLLLVLVTQLDDVGETKLRSSLVEKFSKTPVDVDIRLMDFEGLQRVFAND